MPMKLSHIASALDVRLENGSPDTEITGLNGIEQAGPGELTFVSNPKYAAAARSTQASAVIVGEDFPAIAAAMLRAKDPYLTFARALELFFPPLRYAPDVRVGPDSFTGACRYLSRSKDRRQFFRACARHRARELPARS